jgi:hypothetical protein
MTKINMLNRLFEQQQQEKQADMTWAYVEAMKHGKRVHEINPSYNIFQGILEKHDWYYHYSDDHRVWSKGEEVSKLIAHIRRLDPVFEEMYLQYLDAKGLRVH